MHFSFDKKFQVTDENFTHLLLSPNGADNLRGSECARKERLIIQSINHLMSPKFFLSPMRVGLLYFRNFFFSSYFYAFNKPTW